MYYNTKKIYSSSQTPKTALLSEYLLLYEIGSSSYENVLNQKLIAFGIRYVV